MSNLPPLPTHAGRLPAKGYRFGRIIFTADQMRAYAEEAVRLERERCAQACEDRAAAYRRTQAPGWHEVDHECTQCAYAIRAQGEKNG